MRIDETSNQARNMNQQEYDTTLQLNWAFDRPDEGTLPGFVIACEKTAGARALALKDLEERDCLPESSTYLTETGRPDYLLYYRRAEDGGTYSASCTLFRPPCVLEVWSVVREMDGTLVLRCGNRCRRSRTLRIFWTASAVQVRPERSEGRLFRRRIIPAVNGVRLTVSAQDDASGYPDGAVYYTWRNNPLRYPVAGSALDRPLDFGRRTELLGEGVRYRTEDLYVGVEEAFRDMIDLQRK